MTEKKATKKTVDTSIEKKEDKKSEAVKKEAPKKKVAKKSIKKETEPVKNQKRSWIDRRGKKYRELYKKIEKNKDYTLGEAVKLIKETSNSKFDSSVEIHLNLNIDPKNPDHQIRGSVSLPAGLGKDKKVAVVCKEDRVKEAKEAGANLAGGSELIEKINKGKIEFEVLVATPDMMGELAKAGKVLGPKGLMPNPKDNTVTDNLKATIGDIKKGRAEYRADSYGIVHAVVGKVSFDENKLQENIETLLKEIHNIKPSSIKSGYIKSIYLTTTMGPSVKVVEQL
jgi:large subunit ribosomal protein L1